MSVSPMFLTHFDDICDLLLNWRTTIYLESICFIKYRNKKIINDFIYPSIDQKIMRKNESKCKNNTTHNIKL